MPNWRSTALWPMDAPVGVLGDEQVVGMLGSQDTQQLPLRGAEILALVDQHVIG
jgi:hypothetical protein